MVLLEKNPREITQCVVYTMPENNQVHIRSVMDQFPQTKGMRIGEDVFFFGLFLSGFQSRDLG